MASLANNKWYKRYLEEVASGQLELPGYEQNSDGSVKIQYGEVFCRVLDCSKAQKRYTATNNLHTHIKSHEGVKLQEGNAGGRVAQKVIDKAVQWYKELFSAPASASSPVAVDDGLDEATQDLPDPPEDDEDNDDDASDEPSSDEALPPLPMKKDGTVHITNMRKKVVEMGVHIPCNGCASWNACCKDATQCHHFRLFDCSKV